MTTISLTLASSEHGFDDFNVANLPHVHRACVGKGIKKGDIFNVYCDGGRKLGATWKGDINKSLEDFAENNSLYRELCAEDIIWTDDDSNAASAQGWDIFESSGDEVELQLQRNDEMEVFATDDEAALFVKEKAAEGDELAKKAIAYLMQARCKDAEKFFLNAPEKLRVLYVKDL